MSDNRFECDQQRNFKSTPGLLVATEAANRRRYSLQPAAALPLRSSLAVKTLMKQHPLSKYFDDFSDCILLRRDVDKVILKVPDDALWGGPLLIKIYQTAGRLQRIRNFLFRKDGGNRDYRVCRELDARGVAVPEPLGTCADGPVAGLAHRTLFACRWVEDAIPALAIFRQWIPRAGASAPSPWTPETQRDFLSALGRFIAGLHAKRVRLNDLNPGNILYQSIRGAEFRFFLIDYEGVFLRRHVSRRRMLSNLAQVAAVPIQVQPKAADDLCCGYAQISRQFDPIDLAEQVAGLATAISMRWKTKLDHNFESIGRTIRLRHKGLEE